MDKNFRLISKIKFIDVFARSAWDNVGDLNQHKIIYGNSLLVWNKMDRIKWNIEAILYSNKDIRYE